MSKQANLADLVVTGIRAVAQSLTQRLINIPSSSDFVSATL